MQENKLHIWNNEYKLFNVVGGNPISDEINRSLQRSWVIMEKIIL